MIDNNDSEWIDYGHNYMPYPVYKELTDSCDWMLIMTPVSLINHIDALQGMIEKFINFGGLKIE